jgi:23S rRNA pseudouridine2605 synthase
MKERIQKVLANAGVASRRNIEALVLEGRVAINGRVATQLPILVDPETDRIEVDGERVKLRGPTEQKYYFILNKPRGVYSTNVAQGAQVRAVDLLPKNLKARLYPVGRLDADSKGLLLLTNDGDLTNRLTHPRYGVAKTYRAVVDGYITPEAVESLEHGIWLADKRGLGFKTGRSHIRVAHRTRLKSVLDITIREGRNRQIRRMLARLGHKVKDLTRIRMGPLKLEGLAPGQFRPLTPRELKELRKSASEGKKGKNSDEATERRRGGDGEQARRQEREPGERKRP